MSETEIEIPVATFKERFIPGIFDYIGPFMLFFVGAFVQTPVVGIGLVGIILGAICELLGIVALFFINGYVPGINRGLTPNKKRHGVKIMKIANKETMELRQIEDSDLGIMLLRAFIGWIEIFLLIIPGILPLIIISSSKYNQRLADMVANTVVIKTEPVEKINLKEFRLKRSAPYPEIEDEAVPSEKAVKVDKIEETKVKSEKVETRVVSETQSPLINIGKILVIVSTSILIVCFVILIAFQINISTNNAIEFFAGTPNYQGWFYSLRNVANIIMYIASFILVGSLVLILIPLEPEIRIHFILATSFFLLSTILRIIATEISVSDYKLIAYVDLFSGSEVGFIVSISKFVLRTLRDIFLIVALFMLNKGMKSLIKVELLPVKTLKCQIFLIVTLSFNFIVIVLGFSIQPTQIFAVVMYFLWKIGILLTYIAMISVSAGVMKLRKIAS
ncbi:MAG: hypothetical protein FK733_04135 [Asgard group archaeon]|nr:hypothetical protein [Asgard group archaeon]